MERYCKDPGELVEICLHCERERCEGECAEFMAARQRWTKAHGRKKPMIELGGRMMSVSDFARA